MKKKSGTYIAMFSVVIVVIITALVSVYIYSAAQNASRKAKGLNSGSGICANIIASYVSSGNEEEFSDKIKDLGYFIAKEDDIRKIYFDSTFMPQKSSSTYAAVIYVDSEITETGELKNITVSFNRGTDEIYSLSSQKYVPNNQS